MKLKLIFMLGLVVAFLHAEDTTTSTSLTMNKKVYSVDDKIVVTVSEMLGDKKDWIAIYKAGTSTEWSNVLQWKWTDGINSGNFTFDKLPAGKYVTRVFFKNSYNVVVASTFRVKAKAVENSLEVTTTKNTYLNNEEIIVNYKNMSGDLKDWIAIYPKGASNDWNNVLRWSYTDGDKMGEFNFDALEVGSYEVRAFFKNSYNLEKVLSFNVEEIAIDPKASVSTSKNEYLSNEAIVIDFKNMPENEKDWIAVYLKKSSTEWKNVQAWSYTEGLDAGTMNFKALPAGEYEVRAFFNNLYNIEARQTFTVVNPPVVNNNSTVYENAENGLSDKWIHHSGNYAPERVSKGFKSDGAIALAAEWTENGTVNIAEYYLPLHNETQKILEIDVGGVGKHLLPNKDPGYEGHMSHFGIGLTIHTKNGKRKMIWDSFLNHENVAAYSKDYGNGNIWLYFPSPVEHVRGYMNIDVNQWDHFRVNAELELKKLEPDNEITSIDFLLVTGGFLDNIKLSTK